MKLNVFWGELIDVSACSCSHWSIIMVHTTLLYITPGHCCKIYVFNDLQVILYCLITRILYTDCIKHWVDKRIVVVARDHI